MRAWLTHSVGCALATLRAGAGRSAGRTSQHAEVVATGLLVKEAMDVNSKDIGQTDLQQVRKAFDAWADHYDASVAEGGGVIEGYDRSRIRASGLVSVHQGMRTADIGIGTGAFAEIFAQQGAQITGVDLSPRMLDICAARHPEWRLLTGDFLHIPVASASQDLVISSFAFHELAIADRAAAINECMRLLKRGGRFLLVDIMFEDLSHLQEARARLRDSWDEENYPLFPDLSELAGRLSLEIELELLSDLHGAALLSRR